MAVLPTDYAGRKAIPLALVLDYFPLALCAVARVIAAGQAQHGTQGWDRAKSVEHESTMLRHFLERGTEDTDGTQHSWKMLWRALAMVEKEEEQRLGLPISRGSYDSSKGQSKPGDAVAARKYDCSNPECRICAPFR